MNVPKILHAFGIPRGESFPSELAGNENSDIRPPYELWQPFARHNFFPHFLPCLEIRIQFWCVLGKFCTIRDSINKKKYTHKIQFSSGQSSGLSPDMPSTCDSRFLGARVTCNCILVQVGVTKFQVQIFWNISLGELRGVASELQYISRDGFRPSREEVP